MTTWTRQIGRNMRLVGVLAALPLAGTAQGVAGPTSSDPVLSPDMQSRSYRTVEVIGGVTLKGAVVFSGEIPRPRRLLITKDVEACGEGYRERHDVVATSDGSLQNVVVYIEHIEEGKHWGNTDQDHSLNQEDCYFTPYLQVVPRGAQLHIINSDPVLHNIHSYEMIGRTRRTLFNLGQPDRGTITRALTPRRGNQIRLECDAHDFMLGWIYSAHTPYYSLVDATGRFEISDIPPGTYLMKAWHPFLGTQEREVTVGTGDAEEITFLFSSR